MYTLIIVMLINGHVYSKPLPNVHQFATRDECEAMTKVSIDTANRGGSFTAVCLRERLRSKT